MGALRTNGRWVVLALLVAGGGRCPSPVERVGPAELVIDPGALDFDATYVGFSTRRTVDVTNQGGAPASIELSTSPPFASETGHLELSRGAGVTVGVTFAPTVGGAVSGVLQVGELQVPLTGTGLRVPQCAAPAVCGTSAFDPGSGACVQALASDGTACQTRCVTGACSAGSCAGTLASCDDGDACTIDACSEEAGCDHVPRTCPAPAVTTCRIATCDSRTGCGEAVAPDGTVCGFDDCAALEVNVCISGQCETRPRPATSACANRGVPDGFNTWRWVP